MLNKLATLIKTLNKKNIFLFELFRFASEYDDVWKDKIEEISKYNKKPFNDWFDGKDRVYIPFDIDTSKILPSGNLASFFEYKGIKIINYIDGICEVNGKRIKIGKYFQKMIDECEKKIYTLEQENKSLYQMLEVLYEKSDKESDLDEKYRINNLLSNNNSSISSGKSVLAYYKNNFKEYNTDPVREFKQKECYMVISQNAHDIAKASTERRWRSCLNLQNGEYKHSLICEVMSGGIIAYIISKDDLDIKNPWARILIKRFVDENGNSYAIQEPKIYGLAVNGFKEELEKWLSQKQGPIEFNSPDKKENKLYKQVGGHYSDRYQTSILGYNLITLTLPQLYKVFEKVITLPEKYESTSSFGAQLDEKELNYIKTNNPEILVIVDKKKQLNDILFYMGANINKNNYSFLFNKKIVEIKKAYDYIGAKDTIILTKVFLYGLSELIENGKLKPKNYDILKYYLIPNIQFGVLKDIINNKHSFVEQICPEIKIDKSKIPPSIRRRIGENIEKDMIKLINYQLHANNDLLEAIIENILELRKEKQPHFFELLKNKSKIYNIAEYDHYVNTILSKSFNDNVLYAIPQDRTDELVDYLLGNLSKENAYPVYKLDYLAQAHLLNSEQFDRIKDRIEEVFRSDPYRKKLLLDSIDNFK